MSDAVRDLEIAKQYLESALKQLDNAPELNAIVDLINACEAIDENYREGCLELDDDWGEKEGTTYDRGYSIEYYIEASWWNDVSQALRKLRKPE